MEDNVEEFEPIVTRLRAFGESPVPLATTSRVLMAARGAQRPSFFRSTKLKVAAGIAGGFMVGSIGLAGAGTLPAPVQEVAHEALAAVGVDVPPGHERYSGPECGGAKNHGEYVRAHPDDPEAAKSDCGKPLRSLNHENKGKSDEDHGKPADAGENKGKSGEDHGKPADAGENKGKSGEDHGRPADAGKPADPGSQGKEHRPTTTSTSTTSTSTTSTSTTSTSTTTTTTTAP